MTSNQPHIREMSGFDPAQGFGRTFFSAIQLIEGHKESPDTLPIPELLHAAQVAIDTLEIITELAVGSLTESVRALVTPEQWSDFRLEVEARQAAMSPNETIKYKIGLLAKLSQYSIPHEVNLDDNPED